MIQEVQPKGYSNWTQYWLGSKRRALKENLKVLAVVTLIFLAYCIVGYMEY
jgi:hypothetical protein